VEGIYDSGKIILTMERIYWQWKEYTDSGKIY
jgi:hypothetical protein